MTSRGDSTSLTPPTFKGIKYEPIEDLMETGNLLDADKDDLEMAE